MYNTMMPFNPYQQNQNSSLIRVDGIEGAKAYSMPMINSTVALFDSNDDIFYVKSTDGAGFPTIRTFRFEEVVEKSEYKTEYVNKNDFEDFKAEVKKYVEHLIRSEKPKQNGTNGTSKGNN